ncbi:MAG: DNA methylase [Deltaproteobacteria bacterium]|nr:DNA methylase [Deltaproteobacteria bacterium]
MSIERRFDVPLIAELALREKQIQQNYRPIIGVHKWFARRPGTLFRGLMLAEFGNGRLEDAFFRSNDLSGTRIADPFMGGGTPLIEANRLGCAVQGFDINPMAAWIVREEIEHLDVAAYERAARSLIAALDAEIGPYFRTSCPRYGDTNVPVKSFLWVKVSECEGCRKPLDLFPGYLLAENKRHPKNVLVCPVCGELNEVDDRRNPGDCTACGTMLTQTGPARRGRCACPSCGYSNVYPGQLQQPLEHRLFAIEYHNPKRKTGHKGRFFKKPDAEDLTRMADAVERWARTVPRFVPDQEILPGDETHRLHRWGYTRYRDMFNPRQLLGLELSCRLVAETGNRRIRHALATNLSDLLRYQNMLCRYDTMALKSLDIFSVHGFPVGLVQCESNFLGIANGGGVNVGSGGWSNIVDKYAKAKRYCQAPFEVQRHYRRKVRVPIDGEWIGERLNDSRREVAIRCEDAADVELTPRSLDAVFTDPPYFGNVQYGELMDFCYVWLRRLAGNKAEGFDRPSTRSPSELTGNVTEERGLEQFTEGLAKVYSRMADGLKLGAPLVFTYHHNKLEAYYAVGVAILDARLVCSASLPCPAEMGGSIHIHGTASSIIDTVFVCRASGATPKRWLFESPEQLSTILREDLEGLERAGRTPTHGDRRCIVFGHLTRMAVWKLRERWNVELSTRRKLANFAEAVLTYGNPEQLVERVATGQPGAPLQGSLYVADAPAEERLSAVPF